jgi:outer membrane protein TolC
MCAHVALRLDQARKRAAAGDVPRIETADRLAQAQSREVQALGEYEIAQVDIAFATGTLLGHGRVILPRAR